MWSWCSRLRPLVAAVTIAASLPAAAVEFWQATIERLAWQQAAAEPLELNAVRELLSRFEEAPGVRVVIRYPGGDAGTAWARELRDWLVGYGVPLDYQELQPGSGGLDILHVSISGNPSNSG